MIPAYELDSKIQKIVDFAQSLEVKISKRDAMAIVLWKLNYLNTMSIRLYCLIHHGVNPNKLRKNPKKYGLKKITGGWVVPVNNSGFIITGSPTGNPSGSPSEKVLNIR